MRSVKYIVAAGAASLLSSAAFAADMPIMSPPLQPYYAPPPQDFGGWYLRGDIGMTNSRGRLHVDLFDTLPAGSTLTHSVRVSPAARSTASASAINSTAGSALTSPVSTARVSHFSGTDFATFPGGSTLSDVYQGGYTSWVGLANVYVDLGTWWCLTPFVGVGVGAAHITDHRLQDSGRLSLPASACGNPCFVFRQRRIHDQLRLGRPCRCCLQGHQQLHGRTGLSLSRPGHRRSRLRPSRSTAATPATSSFQFRDLTSQDVKLGVRWTCCDVPPPPPLVTKG